MKKILYILVLIILLPGCNLGNTPTAKTEDLLTRYQSLDKSIKISSNDLIKENNLSEKYIQEYEKLIKKQYENLSYEVKEEVIDGDSATVTTKIEVLDYKDILTKYNIDINTDEYHNKLIKELKKANKKITYTIDFTLTKNDKDKWELDELTIEQKDKLLGIF